MSAAVPLSYRTLNESVSPFSQIMCLLLDDSGNKQKQKRSRLRDICRRPRVPRQFLGKQQACLTLVAMRCMHANKEKRHKFARVWMLHLVPPKGSPIHHECKTLKCTLQFTHCSMTSSVYSHQLQLGGCQSIMALQSNEKGS